MIQTATKTLIVPGEEPDFLKFCADHFLQAYEEAVKTKGYFTIALSGGSTPKAIFMLLNSSAYKNRIDPKKLRLYWSDERNVSPDDPMSNYKMAMDAGFKDFGIPPDSIFRMEAEDPIEEGVKRYTALVNKVMEEGGFDYLMLGMGEDGHTASLFPGTTALAETERFVVANKVPQKDTVRMTLTYPCINASKNIVIYVSGEKKQAMLQEIFTHTAPCYPIEKVGTETHKALWIADYSAARPLLKSRHF